MDRVRSGIRWRPLTVREGCQAMVDHLPEMRVFRYCDARSAKVALALYS